MPRFEYQALTATGERVDGALDAADEPSAVSQLQSQGFLPIRVSAAGSSGLMALLNTEITPRDALSEADRIAFTRMLATLAGAGLPLDRALEMTRDLGGRRAVSAVSARLLESVRGGASLAAALDKEQAVFPALYRRIVEAGEVGAALEITLARLADTLEDAARRRGELRSALIYPAFLLVTAIGSVAVLLSFVVPTFQPLLDEAGVEPPWVTQVVIAVGDVVGRWWRWALAGIAGAFAAFRLALLIPEVRRMWHAAALRLPLIGRLWRTFETARFARLLGALLQNGVALPTGLRLVRGALANAAFAAEVGRIIPEVEAGRGLAEPLAETGAPPALALQLIRVGEESGRLTEMLLKTAEILETDGKRGFEQALAFLTPTLTLVMGGLIAVIVSSILFALFSINELAI